MLDLTIRHQLKKFELNISLQANQELLALFGPSGSGKSMTLQAVAGLVRPDVGYISLNDTVVFDSRLGLNLPPQQRQVGYVTQDYTLFPHLSVAENIAYGLRGRSKQQIRRAVADMLDLIQLAGFDDHQPDELSGGQKQRVALARALVTGPKALLLDEPFSALDGPTRAQLRLELRQLQAQVRIPTLLVTHDLAEANVLANRIAVYDAGQLLQVGSPSEIMRRPANLQVARLTGTQNCFRGEVQAVTERGLQVAVGPLVLDTPPYPFRVGQQVHCCLRPEQVIMLRPGRNVSRRTNRVEGEIVSIMTDGLSFYLQLCLIGERLRPERSFDLKVALPLHVYESLTPEVGQVWEVSLKQSAIHLVAR
jgi:molybdate transport system ATP-binding protein